MNGKRVRMAVMSAVILSALAVSGCSSEGSVSYNGSGEKADDVSASRSTPVTSDTTNSSESKETQEQTSSETSLPLQPQIKRKQQPLQQRRITL